MIITIVYQLNENRQYATNMDFSGGSTHSFTVTAQDGIAITTYTIGVLQQQDDSKEIISFAFQETGNSLLKVDIAMDIDLNSRAVTKTVTNVEGITGLIPTIVQWIEYFSGFGSSSRLLHE